MELEYVQHSDCWLCGFESHSGYAGVSQLAEEIGSNPIECGFESHRLYLEDKI